MRNFLCYAAAVAMVTLAVSADAATATKKKKTSHAKTTTSSTSSKKKISTTKGGTTSAHSAGKKSATSKKGTATARKTTWRNRQLSPTPDRYKEIQQALASKGYLNPEDASGAWGQASVDALKKFQSAQNLEPNGKINSLSLIALGLGPKRETTTESPQF